MIEGTARLIESIGLVLRYVAPGFVAVIVVAASWPGLHDEPKDFLLTNTSAAVFLAFTIGVTLNSVHVALLEDLFSLFVLLFWYLPFLNQRLPESIRQKGLIGRFRALEEQRMRRKASSPDTPAKKFQDKRDAFAANLTFLYCSSYTGLGIALYQCFAGVPVSPWALWSGVGLLVAGIVCDLRYFGLDIWGCREFPLEVASVG